MSITTSGTVVETDSKEVKTKFGMKPVYSFKLDDGVWYKHGFKDPKLSAGMAVEFDYTPGKYGNDVTDGSITARKVGTAPSPPFVPRSGGKGVFPIPPDDGQRSIVRQNALTNARELVCATQSFEPGSLELIVTTVIAVARQFESYTAGDSDLAAVEESLAKH